MQNNSAAITALPCIASLSNHHFHCYTCTRLRIACPQQLRTGTPLPEWCHMRFIKFSGFLSVVSLILYIFLSDEDHIKYDHISKNTNGEIEIYFSSNNQNIAGAYNISCALSEKTKYPNVFPEEGVAIFGNKIKSYSTGRYIANIDVRGHSKSGEYFAGKLDLLRELKESKVIDCIIYRRGFFNWNSATPSMSIPADQFLKLYE